MRNPSLYFAFEDALRTLVTAAALTASIMQRSVRFLNPILSFGSMNLIFQLFPLIFLALVYSSVLSASIEKVSPSERVRSIQCASPSQSEDFVS